MHSPRVLETQCAWRAAEMSDEASWTESLTREELEELDAALRLALEKSTDVLEVGREDFPLPTLAATLATVANDVENGRGIVLMRGHDFDRYSFDEIRTLYWGIGLHLGTAVSQNPLGEMMAAVTDRGYDQRQNNVRGYTTRQSPIKVLILILNVVGAIDGIARSCSSCWPPQPPS